MVVYFNCPQSGQKGDDGMNGQLRGAVYAKYRTITAFANTIGWSYSKASRIVNEEQNPSAAEIALMAKTLEITNPSDFMRIFFDDMSTKWTA